LKQGGFESFPDLDMLKMVRGAGFEPANPYGSGSPNLTSVHGFLSPPPLTWLGDPNLVGSI